MKSLFRYLFPLVISLLIAIPGISQGATIASDGGLTLWISYDDLDNPGANLDDEVTVIANNNCNLPNNIRSFFGALASPGSCGDGTINEKCTGKEKLTGDLEKFANYLYEASEGAHYLRHVYISDQGRSWETADVQWNIGGGGSSAWPWGWKTLGKHTYMNNALSTCIHDIFHHEIGHYLYSLADRYPTANSSNSAVGDYYQGNINGGAIFNVNVNQAALPGVVPQVLTGDWNTVMNFNFPHKFVDATNASLTVSYTEPGEATVNNQALTPALLDDPDPENHGPYWAKFGFTHPFAKDEWSYISDEHIDLAGVHTEGDFSDPDFDNMPEPQFHFIGADVLSPGSILLLDRSGSMQVETNGVSAAQFVQEAGLYLYHSTPAGEFVGAYVYNAGVDPLIEYGEYVSNFVLPADPGQGELLSPIGQTNIALALETAINAFVAEHGEGGANGGQIFLMSDGKQTVGNDLFDQVERAEQLGIMIHTFTYGNADAATMADISSTTSGDGTAMSAAENGSELKLGMAKQFSLIRGNTPVYSFKGQLTKTGVSGGQEYFQDAFQLPPTAQYLRFYAFRANGNASKLDIRLKDSNGQNANFDSGDLPGKGRFAGARVKAPLPGKWTIQVFADKRGGELPEDTVEIVAYADDRSLDGRAWFRSGPNSVARKMQLRAYLDYQYVLTGMEVRAHFYRDGKRVAKVRMYDDGERGGDHDRADGVYSAELDMRRLQRKLGLRWMKTRQGIQNPKVRIDVQYLVSKHSVPAPNHHYTRGTGYRDLLEDYRPAEFEAWTTLVQSFARKSPKPVLQRIRPRTVTTGGKYRTTVAVLNARPPADQIRLSLGRGIQAHVDRVYPRRDRLGVTLRISYRVARDALPGRRDLKIQFGDSLLVGKGVVNVRARRTRGKSSATLKPRVTPSIRTPTVDGTVPTPSVTTPTVGGSTLRSD